MTLPQTDLELRAYIKAGKKAIEETETDKIARNLAALPEPEVRARPIALKAMPRSPRLVAIHAHDNGFNVRASYARGPRVDQYWRCVEISDSIQIKAEHPDGRRVRVAWITKTPNLGKPNQGIPTWYAQCCFVMVGGIWTACGVSQLDPYFTKTSLPKEA